VIIIGMAAGFAVLRLNLPPHVDEWHYVDTIRHWGGDFRLSSLVDYDEVTGPLVFILYALWGKIVGFELNDLRLLSLLFSAGALFIIFHWYKEFLPVKAAAMFALFLFLLNPYMWGLSFFVYTDIPTLFFLILLAWAVHHRQTILIFTASAAALLCRQYSVYLVIAAGLYQIVFLIKGNSKGWKNLLALFFGGLPLIILMALWGGFAPPAGVKRWILPDRLYHFDYITTYIASIAVYLSPIILWVKKRLFRGKILWIGLVITGWYVIFPIKPSLVTLAQTQLDTVGFAHRLIKMVTGDTIFEHIILGGFFYCGLITLANVIFYDFKRLQKGVWDYAHFLTLSVICFLLVMPFSFHVWEKYLVIVLPFILLRLIMIKHSEVI